MHDDVRLIIIQQSHCCREIGQVAALRAHENEVLCHLFGCHDPADMATKKSSCAGYEYFCHNLIAASFYGGSQYYASSLGAKAQIISANPTIANLW